VVIDGFYSRRIEKGAIAHIFQMFALRLILEFRAAQSLHLKSDATTPVFP